MDSLTFFNTFRNIQTIHINSWYVYHMEDRRSYLIFNVENTDGGSDAFNLQPLAMQVFKTCQ